VLHSNNNSRAEQRSKETVKRHQPATMQKSALLSPPRGGRAKNIPVGLLANTLADTQPPPDTPVEPLNNSLSTTLLQRSLLPISRSRSRNHNGERVTTGIQPEGESGRSGINPIKFFSICWQSTSNASRLCNILWPIVPAAIAVRYSRADLHLAIFILNYLAMVPCANLIGFAGQEMARKLHKVFGVLLETTLGSVVEIVMFMVLVKNKQYQVIQAAILGSVLATQLLCLGMCFVVGGLRHEEQEFDEEVGEIGSDLLLTA
jgi:Ca2+:H+ antiporter